VTRAEAEALLANPDLIAIGMKGEEARKARTGERVTYGRVLRRERSRPRRQDTSEAGEIRLMDRPASFEEAVSRVRDGADFCRRTAADGFFARGLAGAGG
jgi:hypothetical protein